MPYSISDADWISFCIEISNYGNSTFKMGECIIYGHFRTYTIGPRITHIAIDMAASINNSFSIMPCIHQTQRGA